MKLQRLRLLRYGHFADRTVELPDSPLCVLLGPNEAGKSTVRSGLLDLLFGVPHRSTMNFGFDGRPEVHAGLTLADGRTLQLERRKRTKDTLAGAFGDGATLDSSGLAALLGVDRALYADLFGFALADLERGEALLNQAAFSAVLTGGSLGGGGQRVTATLERLDEQARALLGRTGKRPINALLSELRTSNRELKESVLGRNRFLEARRGWDDATALADRLGQELAEPQAELRRLGELLKAWQDLAELRDADEPREGLLAHGATLNRLAKGADRVRGERDRLATEAAELGEAEADLASALQQAWPGAADGAMRGWSPAPGTLEAARAAVEAAGQRATEQLDARRILDRETKRIADLQEQLAGADEADDPTLAALISGLDDLVRDQTEHTRLAGDLDESRTRRAAIRARLRPPLPDSDAASLPLPADELVQSLQAEGADALAALEQGKRDLRKAADQVGRLKAELAKLLDSAGLPGPTELQEARDARDSLWAAIRAGDQPPDESYERAVAAADRVADALVAGAAAVAQVQSRRVDLAGAELQAVQCERAIERGDSAHRLWRERWFGAWAACGVEPGEPASMLDWLRSVRSLMHEDERAAGIERQLRGLSDRITAFDQRVVAALGPGEGDRVPALREAARRSQRKQAQRDQQRADLAEAEARAVDAQQRLDELAQREQRAVAEHGARLTQLGLEEDLSPTGLVERLRALAGIALRARELAERRRGHETAARHVSEFERAVAELLQSLNAEDGDPLDAVTALHAELLRAQRVVELRARLRRQLDGEAGLAQAEATATTGDHDQLSARRESLRAQVADLSRRQLEAAGAAGEAKSAFEALGRSAALDAAGRREELRAELAEHSENWAVRTLAHGLLQRVVERYARDHQPQLLKLAGETMGRITGGRWTGVEQPFGRDEVRLVSADDGRSLSPHQLSTGTREQLFLALRMAYVAESCAQREPLPVLVDDALVNFDRERAGRALEGFQALGAQTQVLYLTCHPHLAELARDVGGAVVELEAP